jgi:hypothetical protein
VQEGGTTLKFKISAIPVGNPLPLPPFLPVEPNNSPLNIPNQFKQIGVFLAYDGFISVLEKLSMPPVLPVVRHRIAG